MAKAREAPGPAGRSARSSAARYRKLSPGPGRPASEVAAHQRARIHAAMVAIAGERGYGALTVRGLARAAGVSTRAFYEHFGGKEECLLGTYELLVRRAARRIAAARGGEREWRERLRAALRACAAELEREPRAARLVLVEAPAAGPAARERTQRAEGAFEAIVADCFARAPDGWVVPPLLVKGIAAGVVHVARARLLAGRERELPALAGELAEWALCCRCEAPGRLDARSVPLRGGAELPLLGEAVGADERALILSAAARLAASEGYDELSVPRIRALAGVSRKSFEAHFDGVEDCFLAALELRTDRALADAASQGAAARTWPAGVHRALAALCAHVAGDPVRARLGFVEVFAAGPDGMRCRARLIGNVAELLRASAPADQRPGELAAEASVGAIWGILQHQIATGRTRRLPRIAATLSYLALAPAIGADAAVEAIREEQARARNGAAARAGHSPLSGSSGPRGSNVR